MTIELLFATGNPAKLAQLSYVVDYLGAPIKVVSARERFGDDAIYEESGASAHEIAQRGAVELARQLNTPIVVEDTTFHVDALDGGPGVLAGRYLTENGRSAILQATERTGLRKARIISVVAWSSPDGSTQTWTNAVVGEIARNERWRNGMPTWIAPTADDPLGGGYNAIFIPEGLGVTLAEVPPATAVAIGYREPNFCALVRFVLSHADQHMQRR